MTIKLDKVVSALAALMISTASLVVVTDAQAREREDYDLSDKARCMARTYGPSHHPLRKRRSIECSGDEILEEGTKTVGAPCADFVPTQKNPKGLRL